MLVVADQLQGASIAGASVEVDSLLDEMELLRAGERSGALLLGCWLLLIIAGASIAGASVEVVSLLDEMELLRAGERSGALLLVLLVVCRLISCRSLHCGSLHCRSISGGWLAAG